MPPTLLPLIVAHRARPDGADTAALHAALYQGTQRLLSRYPDLPGGPFQRQDEISLVISHDTFLSADQRPQSSAPYLGKPPFAWCAAARPAEEEVQGRVLWWRRSVARAEIRRHLQKAARRDPTQAARGRLYQQLGLALPSVAVPIEPLAPTPGEQRWRLRSDSTLRLLRASPLSFDQLMDKLRGQSSRTVPAIIEGALAELGWATKRQLWALIEALLAPAPPAPAQLDDTLADGAPSPEDHQTAAEVRTLVAQAFARLSPLDQELLRRVGRGESSRSLIGKSPALANEPAVSAHLKGINAIFLDHLQSHLQLRGRRSPPPRVLAALLLDVLEDGPEASP